MDKQTPTLAAAIQEAAYNDNLAAVLTLCERCEDEDALVQALLEAKDCGLPAAFREAIADRLRTLRRGDPSQQKVLSQTERWLPVELTEQERADAAVTVVSLTAEIAQLEADKKAAMERLRDQIKSAEAERTRQVERHKTGQENRTVEVAEVLYPEARVVRTVRLDTGEVLEVRPATGDELQLELEL